MSGVFSAVRRAKDVFVGFVTPQSASAAKLENLARVVLHLDSINGSVVLYGQKPYTELFGLAWDWSGGVPKADLRPIVGSDPIGGNGLPPPDPQGAKS